MYPHRACYGGAPRCFALLFVAFLLQISEIRQQFCWIRGGPCRARSQGICQISMKIVKILYILVAYSLMFVIFPRTLSDFHEICQNSLHVCKFLRNFREIRYMFAKISIFLLKISKLDLSKLDLNSTHSEYKKHPKS